MNTSEHLSFFAKLIKDQLGIVYDQANDYQLQGRLETAATQLGFVDVDSFFRAAKQTLTAEMKAIVLGLATNHETQFFRDPAIFEAVKVCAKEWLASNPAEGRRFRVWSAACSFGQEVYSLAMSLRQCPTSRKFPWFEIVATDVSQSVLNHARSGIYSELQIFRGLTANDLAAHFQKISSPVSPADKWQVNPELKQGLTFQHLNLLDSFKDLGSFNLVLCRNVLIYQEVANRQDIIRRLAERLEADGHLILGAAESLLGISDAFDQVRAAGATIYRRRHQMQKAG